MNTVFLATESVKYTGATFTTPFSSKENADLFIDYRQKSGELDNSIFYKQAEVDVCYARIYKDSLGYSISVLWCKPNESVDSVFRGESSIFATVRWNIGTETLDSVLDRGTKLIEDYFRVENGEGIFFAIVQILPDSGEVRPFPFIYTTEKEASETLTFYAGQYDGVYQIVSGTIEEADKDSMLILSSPMNVSGRVVSTIPILSKRR